MSKSHSILKNDFCNQFIEYFRKVSTLSAPETLHDIANHPKHYGLEPKGISHSIIKMHVEHEIEQKINAYIKSKDRDLAYGGDDSKYRNSPLHWCAILNYTIEGLSLAHNGLNKTNLLELKPDQLAVIFGNEKFVDSHHIANSRVDISNLFSLDMLSIAILLGDTNYVSTLVKSLGMFGAMLSQKSVGNILHVIVYAALIEMSYLNHMPPINTIHMFNIIKPFLKAGTFGTKDSVISKLLSDSYSNFEKCTPVELAKKYGLDFMGLFVNQDMKKIDRPVADKIPLRISLLTTAPTQSQATSSSTMAINTATAAASVVLKDVKQFNPVASTSTGDANKKDTKSNNDNHKPQNRIVELLKELDALSTKPDLSDAEEKGFTDPLTLELMTEPVILADGHPYQRSSAVDFFAKHRDVEILLSPVTRQPFEHRMMTIAIELQGKIIGYLEKKINVAKEIQKSGQPSPPSASGLGLNK